MKGCRSMWSCPNLWHYNGISLEGLRKTMKYLSQESQHTGHNSNQAPSEYKSEALPLQSTCSLTPSDVTLGNMNFKNKLREILSGGNVTLTLLTSYH
jgi:hypothetical protein